MNKLESKKKVQIYTGIVALILWAVTFFIDTKTFTNNALNMNCLPIDTAMVPFMHIVSKLFVLIFLYCFLKFLWYGCTNKTLLIPFLIFMTVYGVGLIITYPGYYMSDDPIIFAYATRYYPVYWHNYLTSLFYMTGMSIFPTSCGPVLLSDICYAIVYAYIYHEGHKVYKGKGKYALIILGVLPFVLLGALMCFRPAVYSSFFVFYFAYLYYEKKKEKSMSLTKVCFLSFLTALLSFWRSEGVVLLVCGVVLAAFVYRNVSRKKLILFFVLSLCFFFIIKIPQTIGENKYYGSDYLIISTTRPLSVIVHREQTYEGAKEDLENISRITEFGYLHNDSLSCSAYNRYNTDYNEGRYTQTGASKEEQKAYLKSALRLIMHNLDLYFGERIQLFLVTNGIYGYNKEIVLGLKPVVATDFHLYAHDRDYGFEMLNDYKRVPIDGADDYALFLFRYGGEAYIPMLIAACLALIFSVFYKKWFEATAFLSLFLREGVIFLTAPASFIQYSYPMMYVTSFLIFVLILEWVQEKKNKPNADEIIFEGKQQ